MWPLAGQWISASVRSQFKSFCLRCVSDIEKSVAQTCYYRDCFLCTAGQMLEQQEMNKGIRLDVTQEKEKNGNL